MRKIDISDSLDKNFCPICNKSSETFNSFGINKRKNAQCPNCQSLERHRLLWLYLQRETNILKGPKKVLHVAPEKCISDRFLSSHIHNYITCDINKKSVDINFDLTTNPFNDNVFDLIICNHVLEHIKDDIKAIKELYRVLKPNGIAILMVPLFKDLKNTIEEPPDKEYSTDERLLNFGQKDHVRKYGRDYITRLRSAGFEVREIDYTREFSDEEKNSFSIISFDLIHECKKN